MSSVERIRAAREERVALVKESERARMRGNQILVEAMREAMEAGVKMKDVCKAAGMSKQAMYSLLRKYDWKETE